jgi:lysophospholipase L1-like esterase
MPYPELLERSLNSSGFRCQVINAGVPGYTSSQAFLYLQRELISYKPGLILVYIGWNNIWTFNNPEANTVYSPAIRALSRSLSKSLTFVVLRDYLINPVKKKLSLFQKKPEARLISADKLAGKAVHFKEDISEIIQIARKGNCRVILFTLPTVIRKGMNEKDADKFPLVLTWNYGYDAFLQAHDRLNEILRTIARADKVDIADLDLYFSELTTEDVKGLFSDAVHPNDKGAAFIAKYVSQRILTKKP